MKNFVQEGDVLPLIAPYAVASGQGFQVGVLFAVAQTTAAISTAVEGATEGVFDITKLAGTAWTAGAAIYWDNSARNCTVVVSTNKLIGYASQAQASGDVIGRVWLPGL